MGNESEAASCKSVGKSHLPKTWLLPHKIFTEFNNFLKVYIAAKYKVMGQCNVVFAMKYFINWKIYMNVQFRFMYITGKLKKEKPFLILFLYYLHWEPFFEKVISKQGKNFRRGGIFIFKVLNGVHLNLNYLLEYI